MIQKHTIQCNGLEIEIQAIDRVSISYWSQTGRLRVAYQRPARIENTRRNGTFYEDWEKATAGYVTFESAPVGLLAVLPAHDTWNIVARDDVPNGMSCLHIDGEELIRLLEKDDEVFIYDNRDWHDQVNNLRPTGR